MGREHEMAGLGLMLDEVVAGRGGLAMLAGEPGIGKSRLADEFSDLVLDRGGMVLRGACLEAAVSEPYWLWSQILADCVAQVGADSFKAVAGDAYPFVAPLVSGILAGAGMPAGVPDQDSGLRMSGALSHILNAVARERLIMIFLDDLHWADRPSLAMLEIIAQTVARSRIMLLGAYRDVELSRSHPLADTLGGMVRLRHFKRVRVRGLDAADTDQIVRQFAGARSSKELLDEVQSVTEGNPFFVREIALEILDSRSGETGLADRQTAFRLPESVREIVGRRLNRVSAECNRVLGHAAIIGRDFARAQIETLERHLDEVDSDPGSLTGSAVASALEEAVNAGLIVEHSELPFVYRFSHALIGQTLEEEFTPGKRISLHAAVALTLESEYGDQADSHAIEIAGHLLHAEAVVPPGKLCRYATLAGQRAWVAMDFAGSERWFKSAANAAGHDAGLQGPKTDSDDERAKEHEHRVAIIRAWLARSRQVPYFSTEERQTGWDQISASFHDLMRLGDTREALAIASWRFNFARLTGLLAVTGRAVALSEPGTIQHGRLLCRHSVALWEEDGDLEKPEKLLVEALEIARNNEDQGLEELVNLHLAQLHQSRWTLEESAEYGEKSLGFWLTEGHQHFTNSPVQSFLFPALAALGRFRQITRLAERILSIVEQRLTPQGWAARTRYWSAIVAKASGEWKAVESYVAQSWDEGPLIKTANQVLNILAGIDTGRGVANVDSLRHVDNEIGLGDGPGNHDFVAPSLAAAAYDLNDDSLMSHAESGAVEMLAWTPAVPRAVVQANLALGFAAVMHSDHESAGRLYADLLPWKDLFDTRASFSYARLLGLLARTAGNEDSVEMHFDAALAGCKAAGFKTEIPRVYRDYARMMIERRQDSGRAMALVEAGSAAADEVSMTPVLEQFDELRTLVSSRNVDNRAVLPDGLSEREVEVLRHITAGKSNQVIADELFISRYTVIRHVSNIFQKTGATNRTEATDYAHRHGLV